MRHLSVYQWSALAGFAFIAALLTNIVQDQSPDISVIANSIRDGLFLMAGVVVIWLTSQRFVRGPSPLVYCWLFLVGISLAFFLQPYAFPARTSMNGKAEASAATPATRTITFQGLGRVHYRAGHSSSDGCDSPEQVRCVYQFAKRARARIEWA